MRNIAPRDGSELEALEQREWLESLEYVIDQGDRGRVQRLLAALRHHARMQGVVAAVHARSRRTSTPSAPRSRRRCPAARRSSAASRASSAGTRWRWWCGPTGCRTASAATSPRSPRRRRCTRSASTISSAARTNDGDADIIYFQGHAAPGIYARAFLEGRLSVEKLQQLPPRAAPRAAACRRIRTRG